MPCEVLTHRAMYQDQAWIWNMDGQPKFGRPWLRFARHWTRRKVRMVRSVTRFTLMRYASGHATGDAQLGTGTAPPQ